MTDKQTQKTDRDSSTHSSSPSSQLTPSQLPRMARRFLWADDMGAVERVILGLGVLCVVLFLLDFIVHRHTYVPGEGFPGFYAIVGFIAFTLIVLGATQLRRVILRNENYYAPFSVDAEEYPEQGLEKTAHTPDDSGVHIDGDASQ